MMRPKNLSNDLKSLEKLFDRLIKDRLNNFFIEHSYDFKIEDISVSHKGSRIDYDDPEENEYDKYSVNMIVSGEDLDWFIFRQIGFLLLNTASYILTKNYKINTIFFDLNGEVVGEFQTSNIGHKQTDGKSLENILKVKN